MASSRLEIRIPTVVGISVALLMTDARGNERLRSAKSSDSEITNSVGMKLLLIPAGKFIMGSPKSEVGRDDDEEQHEVEITRPFYLGKCEVTVGQFRAFVRDTGYRTEPERDGQGGWGYNEAAKKSEGRKPQYIWSNAGFPQTDEHPVANVTWNDAVAFCEWLSRNEGRTYRLPTEAEWEYSCRAGTTTRYYNGNDSDRVVLVGNVADLSGKSKFPQWKTTFQDDSYPFMSPVGKFQPNAFGLYDMHGNLWEWCADWYDADYYKHSPRQDPQGPGSGTFRAARSGCWNEGTRTCRSADRSKAVPSYRSSGVGFRVVLTGLLALAADDDLANQQVELKTGDRILFFGDSLTALAGKEEPKQHVTKGYVRIVRETLQETHKNQALTVDWVATGGHTVPDLLKRVDKDVIAKKPTIVVIQIGCNDARRIPKERFEAGLAELIDRLRNAQIQVIQCTLTSVGEKHDGTNKDDPKLEEFAEVERQVAKAKKVPLNDLRKAFVRYWKQHNPDNKPSGILTYDGNHFNDAGHKFVAEQMLKKFK